jgi:trk system potassium uptake protein TrkA
MNDQQRTILEKLGVQEILSPENEIGKLVAEQLLNPNMRAYLPLPDGYAIVEIKTPRRIVNNPVYKINFRDNYDLDFIAVKRTYDEYINGKRQIVEHLIHRPNDDMVIEHSDMLIVLGKSYDVEKFVELNR